MIESPYKGFSHYEQSNTDFERARIGLANNFDYLDIDLSTARQNQIFNVSGDFLYIDMESTGYATIELNNQNDAKKAPFKVLAGFALEAGFKQIKVSNVAQPGTFLRIIYSTGDKVVPALGQLAITNTVTTQETGLKYGTCYKASNALAANTPEVIFSPAANVNGAIIHQASFVNANAVALSANAYVAKSSAPTQVADGDLLFTTTFLGANNVHGGFSTNKIELPAGVGFYFITNINETAALRSVLYTLK